MYKVKNLKNKFGEMLQKDIQEWIESRNHIVIVNMSIWSDEMYHYASIVYQKVQYCG